MGTKVEQPLLGLGIYDVVEVAELIHRAPLTVARWTTRSRQSKSFLEPRSDGVFVFHDLISLYVISELLRRGVKRTAILAGRDYLTRSLETEYPFAHRRLATVGDAFFAEIHGDWIDAGKWGQAAFKEIVEPLVRPIDFGSNELASVWRPARLVWINPRIQAGTPCVEGTRVPTRQLADLVTAKALSDRAEEYEEVADDYALTVEQVQAAIEFERGLAA
jgi:uncharacterized protein (DUF433 family)